MRCVSLNHDRLTTGRRDKWEAVGVLDGGWTFAHGPQLDADVATRMNADLKILPPE
ncbi:hypothetical protein [Micromonospora sp. NPDC092111]|uniref:hypothetical protein n=1 Tax=Micromonospora sp. NPDC092111 TaxID=3364289 RepID=UPI0037F87280